MRSNLKVAIQWLDFGGVRCDMKVLENVAAPRDELRTRKKYTSKVDKVNKKVLKRHRTCYTTFYLFNANTRHVLSQPSGEIESIDFVVYRRHETLGIALTIRNRFHH